MASWMNDTNRASLDQPLLFGSFVCAFARASCAWPTSSRHELTRFFARSMKKPLWKRRELPRGALEPAPGLSSKLPEVQRTWRWTPTRLPLPPSTWSLVHERSRSPQEDRAELPVAMDCPRCSPTLHQCMTLSIRLPLGRRPSAHNLHPLQTGILPIASSRHRKLAQPKSYQEHIKTDLTLRHNNKALEPKLPEGSETGAISAHARVQNGPVEVQERSRRAHTPH